MLHQLDVEITEWDAAKPVKRVRFSDEVENVFDIDEADENGGSISVENKSNKTSVKPVLEQSQLFTEESMEDSKNSDKAIIRSDFTSTSDSNVTKVNELSSNNEVLNETEEMCLQLNIQSSVDNIFKCSSTTDSNSEVNALNEIINNTKLMSISSAETTHSENLLLSPGELSVSVPSSGTNSEKSILQINMQPSDQKGVTVSRKRSLEEMQINKQTSKLNSCLRKNKSEIKSADEIKTAVFKAWNQVKNEKTPVQNPPCIPDVKKINTSQKTSSQNAYDTWRRSKRKAKKINKISEPVSQKTNEDLEESKMECS